eukprot:15483377-Alexandrium_andersonii.AAC.1
MAVAIGDPSVHGVWALTAPLGPNVRPKLMAARGLHHQAYPISQLTDMWLQAIQCMAASFSKC